MNIVLVGFMGTGKTSVGRALAKQLNRRFVDLDTLIEERAGQSVAEIFRRHGEAHFRALEQAAVAEVAVQDHLVVATGGGVMGDDDNVNRLKLSGLLICLTADPATILQRAQRTTGKRPLLDTDRPGERVAELLKQRAPGYAKAAHTIDTTSLSIQETTAAILRLLPPP